MSYFAMPYRVLFHDTMAYGSHHFMTNFKFQCVIREHLLFDKSLDVTTSEGKREFDKVILLTREGYCRNLAPVRVGETPVRTIKAARRLARRACPVAEGPA